MSNLHIHLEANAANPVSAFVVRFDKDCHATVEIGTPATLSGFTNLPVTQIGTGAKSTAPVYAPTKVSATSLSNVHLDSLGHVVARVAAPDDFGVGCVGLDTLRDPIGIPETELRNYENWTANGIDVTSAYATAQSVPDTNTGWMAYTPSITYGGQYVPAPAIQGDATGSFVEQGGLYYHTQEVDTLIQGDTNCSSNYYISGSVPGNGSYLTGSTSYDPYGTT